MEFNERIKALIKEKKTNSAQLAKAVGVSKPAMSGYLKGSSIPSAIILGKIAKELEITSDYLLFGSKENILGKDEEKLLNYYSKLDKKNKLIAIEEVKHLLEVQKIQRM